MVKRLLATVGLLLGLILYSAQAHATTTALYFHGFCSDAYPGNVAGAGSWPEGADFWSDVPGQIPFMGTNGNSSGQAGCMAPQPVAGANITVVVVPITTGAATFTWQGGNCPSNTPQHSYTNGAGYTAYVWSWNAKGDGTDPQNCMLGQDTNRPLYIASFITNEADGGSPAFDTGTFAQETGSTTVTGPTLTTAKQGEIIYDLPFALPSGGFTVSTKWNGWFQPSVPEQDNQSSFEISWHGQDAAGTSTAAQMGVSGSTTLQWFTFAIKPATTKANVPLFVVPNCNAGSIGGSCQTGNAQPYTPTSPDVITWPSTLPAAGDTCAALVTTQYGDFDSLSNTGANWGSPVINISGLRMYCHNVTGAETSDSWTWHVTGGSQQAYIQYVCGNYAATCSGTHNTGGNTPPMTNTTPSATAAGSLVVDAESMNNQGQLTYPYVNGAGVLQVPGPTTPDTSAITANNASCGGSSCTTLPFLSYISTANTVSTTVLTNNFSILQGFRVANGYASGGILNGLYNTNSSSPNGASGWVPTLWMSTDGHVKCGRWAGSDVIAISTSTYNDGNYHIAMCTWDQTGGNLKIYVDSGTAQATTSGSGSSTLSGFYWTIGGGRISSDWESLTNLSWFIPNAVIGPFAVFNTTLTGAQFTTLLSHKSDGTWDTQLSALSPTVWLKLNDVNTTTATDSAGSDTGTYHNFPTNTVYGTTRYSTAWGSKTQTPQAAGDHENYHAEILGLDSGSLSLTYNPTSFAATAPSVWDIGSLLMTPGSGGGGAGSAWLIPRMED